MKDGVDVVKIAEIFKTFSDPTRLRLIRLLASNMETRTCVVDLAKKLGISQPAASQHIKILKNMRILYSKDERPRIYYYLNFPELKRQKQMIDEVYEMAFSKCEYDGKCENCPNQINCINREQI